MLVVEAVNLRTKPVVENMVVRGGFGCEDLRPVVSESFGHFLVARRDATVIALDDEFDATAARQEELQQSKDILFAAMVLAFREHFSGSLQLLKVHDGS